MLPHSPPLPVRAEIAAATGQITVEFDRLLATGGTAPANWAAVANLGPGIRFHAIQPGGTVLGNFVTMQTVPAGIAFPPAGLTYFATPPELESRQGAAVAAFNDLKLWVV